MSKKERNQQRTDIAKYEPTPDERAAADAVYARRIRTPRVKVSEAKGRIEISLDHANVNFAYAQLMRAFGTGEVDFSVEILSQLAAASTDGGKVNERQLNFMVDVVKGIQPKDQLETMLAVQMAAIHSLTMTFVRRLGNVENIPQQDSAERALNKLARTFAAQVETLKRYRSTGEQKVTVEHVTVNDGGKAIVGNVMHGGPGAPEKP